MFTMNFMCRRVKEKCFKTEKLQTHQLKTKKVSDRFENGMIYLLTKVLYTAELDTKLAEIMTY